MDFIAQNYIWFILGGIIILMTVIGYIAEKTNFGRKEVEERKEKPKKEKKQKEVVAEEPVMEPIEETGLEDSESMPTVPVVPMEEDLNVPLESVPMEETTFEPVLTPVEPVALADDSVEETTEDLYQPLESTPIVPMEEDLNVPLEETPSMESFTMPVLDAVNPEPVIDMNAGETVVTPEISNPIETQPVESTSEVAEDDDIWKF